MDQVFLKRMRDDTLAQLNRALEQSLALSRNNLQPIPVYQTVDHTRRPQFEKMGQHRA